MARKPLSAEETAALRSSPYIAGVVEGRISFTPEFKRTAYERLMQGIPVRETLREHGINPDILGNRRIWGFTSSLRENAGRDEGFADLRRNNCRKPANETREQTLSARVEQLEHELAYTRQEVEFLKKIRAADSEVLSSWESRQHRR